MLCPESNNQISLTPKARTTYPLLDITKFLFSFFVIFIHTMELHTEFPLHRTAKYIIDCAVTFFFIAFGFLLVKDQETYSLETFHKRLLHGLKRILKLYLLWTLIYLPITIGSFIAEKASFEYAVRAFLKGVLWRGENAYSWPLWYLLSTIYALLFLDIAVRFLHLHEHGIYVCACLSFLLVLALNRLSEMPSSSNFIIGFAQNLLQNTFYTGRVFGGLFYIVLGFVFAKHQKQFYSIPNTKRIIICIEIYLFLFFVYMITQPDSLILFRPFTSSAAFIACMTPSYKQYKLCTFCRKSSTVIYLTHMIWYVLYTKFVLHDIARKGWNPFFVVSACTLLTAVVLFLLDRKKKIFKFLF